MTKEIDVSKLTVKQAGAPAPAPVPAKVKKESFLSRVITVVKDDIKSLKVRTGLSQPEGWEDYKRFCELARKK